MNYTDRRKQNSDIIATLLSNHRERLMEEENKRRQELKEAEKLKAYNHYVRGAS